MTTRCGRARHWRILPGTVGMRAPVCIYCGSPNPRRLDDDEWANLLFWWDERPRRWEHLAAAVKERRSED